MISIARKNLSSLFSNPNSFLCNSNLHFLFPIQFHPFSTSRIGKTLINIPTPEICDVLVNKHQLPPELASLASSQLYISKAPEIADSVLSFLKECSFTTNQLEKIIIYDPQILGLSIESLKSQFKVFQNLGLSSLEIAEIMSTNQSIFNTNVANKITPRLSILKSLLGSNEEVARHLRKSPWFLSSDLEENIMPNVEMLKSRGIPMELILDLIWVQPKCFAMKPDIMRKSLDKATEFGVAQTKTDFIYAAKAFAYTSEGMWEVKLQTLRGFGFSDEDIFSMIRKYPPVYSLCVKKMKRAIEVVLATGTYTKACIVYCPRSLTCSTEKRLEPRLQMLRVLESGDELIEKWPPLSIVAMYTDDEFFDRFIRPDYDEIGEENIPKIFTRLREKRKIKKRCDA